MKFGKTYAETISNPSFPAEWKGKAIEYRKLKKVINRVAVELAELGLTAEVLKELLARRDEGQAEGGEIVEEDSKDSGAAVRIEEVGVEESLEKTNGSIREPIPLSRDKGKQKAGKRVARASYEMSG